MSYERNQIIGLLYSLFETEQWMWYFEDGYRIPNHKEIEDTLSELENSAVQHKIAESGRIQVVYDKETQTFDYYLHL